MPPVERSRPERPSPRSCMRVDGSRGAPRRRPGGRSPIVVAACDPWVTLRQLLPEGIVDRKTAARIDFAPANGRVRSVQGRHGAARTMRRSSTPVPMSTCDAVVAHRYEESVRESYAAAARGEPDDPAMWVVAPSGVDPTQAPKGQESLYIYALAEPVHPARGGRRCVRPPSTTFSPNWEVHRTARRSRDRPPRRTPEDLGARLRVRNGCVTHIDMGLMRSGPLRPTMGSEPARRHSRVWCSVVQGCIRGRVTGLPGRTAAIRAKRYLKKRAENNRRAACPVEARRWRNVVLGKTIPSALRSTRIPRIARKGHPRRPDFSEPAQGITMAFDVLVRPGDRRIMYATAMSMASARSLFSVEPTDAPVKVFD